MNAQTVIIVGASSGIGRALSAEYAKRGWRVGASARRLDRLESLKNEYPSLIEIAEMDVLQTETALERLDQLITALGEDIDLIIINAGVGETNIALDLAEDIKMIDTNARAFAVLAAAAYKRFMKQGHGHIAGITSISAERSGPAIAYNASKAFAAQYLEGLRLKAISEKAKVFVSDIRPGFVDTDMIDASKAFWMAPPEKAARQIANALQRKKRIVYITKRWRLISWILRGMPETLFAKLIYAQKGR